MDVYFLVVSSGSLLTNMVLIAIIFKLGFRSHGMLLGLILAGLDLMISVINVSSVSYHLITGHSSHHISHLCSIDGALFNIGIFLSVILVSLTALARASHVFNCLVPVSIKIILALFTGVFTTLIVTCAVIEEQNTFDSCFMTSGLTHATLIIYSLVLMLCLTFTVCCYLGVIVSVMCASGKSHIDSRYLHIWPPNNPTNPWLNKRPIIIRASLTILAYVATILPPAILMLLEALLPSDRTKQFCTPIDIFLASILVVNPSLVILLHSSVSRQLFLCYKKLVSYFIKST
ncbi:hypothetical protein DSO57_1013273 [Entomophthora muscae]|uniref:Uncharacterized protein n=1 Tax=Entomophthora muscae TaxID=34485 RepID=A0ACC2U3H9_9FUNG|nr:hypothetical protein DSO57_1013273 [Entomophthora muscae]